MTIWEKIDIKTKKIITVSVSSSENNNSWCADNNRSLKYMMQKLTKFQEKLYTSIILCENLNSFL